VSDTPETDSVINGGDGSYDELAKLTRDLERRLRAYENPRPREAYKPTWDRKPISIDFDYPIHAFSRGYCQVDIYDEPTPGAHEALKALLRDYAVHILSARDAKEIVKWCRVKFPDIEFALIPPDAPYWQTKDVVGVTNIKLPAIAYIDDRGIRFTNWADIMKYFL
jgi:hypothetical protein